MGDGSAGGVDERWKGESLTEFLLGMDTVFDHDDLSVDEELKGS